MSSSHRPQHHQHQLLRAQVNDVRTIAGLLRAVSFSARATISISEAGLEVTTELDKSVQAHAYLHSAIFSTYEFNPPTPSTADSASNEQLDAQAVSFEVNLHTLLECLNIFGGAPSSWYSGPSTSSNLGASTFASGRDSLRTTAGTGTFRRWTRDDGEDGLRAPADGRNAQDTKTTAMRMSYDGVGTPLVLMLEESGVVTRCELASFEPDFVTDLAYDHERTVGQVIMKSAWLRDALSELDSSSTTIRMLFSPARSIPSKSKSDQRGGGDCAQATRAAPVFRLQAGGDFGSSEMDFPNDKSVMEKFECEYEIQNSYKLTHITHALKALQSSLKTSVRVDDRGLLSLQFMMPRGTGAESAPGGEAGAGAGAASTGASAGVAGAGAGAGAGATPGLTGHGFVELLCCPLED